MPTALLQLTEQQNDLAFEIAQGGRVIVSLGSNRDTGLAWSLAEPLPPQLEEDGESLYEAPPARMGAWGREVFTFRVAAAGSAKLKLKYARESENGARPTRTFSIILNIRSNGFEPSEPEPVTPRRPSAKKTAASQNSAVITRQAPAAVKTAKAAPKKPVAKKASAKKSPKP